MSLLDPNQIKKIRVDVYFEIKPYYVKPLCKIEWIIKDKVVSSFIYKRRKAIAGEFFLLHACIRNFKENDYPIPCGCVLNCRVIIPPSTCICWTENAGQYFLIENAIQPSDTSVRIQRLKVINSLKDKKGDRPVILARSHGTAKIEFWFTLPKDIETPIQIVTDTPDGRKDVPLVGEENKHEQFFEIIRRTDYYLLLLSIIILLTSILTVTLQIIPVLGYLSDMIRKILGFLRQHT